MAGDERGEHVPCLARSAGLAEGVRLTARGGQGHPGARVGVLPAGGRRDHRAGRLVPAKVAALEELGVVWDPHAKDLRDGLADCRAFHAAHGHLDIPRDFRGARTRALAAWVQRRRKEHREGRLDPELAGALEDLGVGWDPVRTRREAGIAAARAFHAEHGHLDVPARAVIGGVRLGKWLSNARHSHHAGVLHPDTTAALNALGIDWGTPTAKNPRGAGGVPPARVGPSAMFVDLFAEPARRPGGATGWPAAGTDPGGRR